MSNSKYTQEFKDSTVQLVLNSGDSASKIAKDLGLNDKTVYNWVKEYKRVHNTQTAYGRNPAKATPKESTEEELKRLRAENRLLKQERDILKKATAYFAKD